VRRERRELGEGGWIELVPGFVPDHERVMANLVAELPLRQEEVHIAGKRVLTPRLTSWHGDPESVYRYSGRTFVPAPWTDELTAIRDALVRVTGVRFDSVLANYYRDGRDGMGAHSDDEPELGPSPEDVRIASVSLGARRRFVLRHKRRDETHELSLGEGDLLVMGGTLQRFYKHHVPKTAKPVGPRLNLTYRVIVHGRARRGH
jgi:alkylated DNA repair dioxygenase AlkB